MGLVLFISLFALLVQLTMIQDLNEFKKKPTKNTSFFITLVGIGITFISLYAFGPPYG